MNLLTQFQSVVYSFIFSLFASFIYSFVNRLVYRFKKTILRLIIQVILGMILGFLYYGGLVVINHGILRFYYIIALAFGYIMYQNYYAFYCLLWIEKLIRKIKKLLSPIYFFYRRFCGILRTAKKRVKQWLKEKKEKKENTDEEMEEEILEE